MDRTILHCDMNSFFASVELLKYPALQNKPVAVCGSPKDRRGIILAKNEAAKKFGIKTAETIWQAQKKCPDLVLLPPHHDQYEDFCNTINSIYLRYTDKVEPFSIDESWLDVTGSLKYFHKNGKEIADEIRNTVRTEIGLTLSAGVSFNKIFAKMGSEYKKPDATTVIDSYNFKELLWPMPVRELFFVGAVTAEKLYKINIKTIGDLALANKGFLIDLLGKQGKQIYEYANGLDKSPVCVYTDHRLYKSVGNGITFKKNLVDIEDVRTALKALSDKVGSRLRMNGLRCRGVKVDIKDPSFAVLSRQVQMAYPTNSSADIFEAAQSLLQSNWHLGDPIRLLTVTGINLLSGEENEQLSFLSSKAEDKENERAVEEAIDNIREKFGSRAIVYGAIINNDLGISEGAKREDGIEKTSEKDLR
ncbi:MAG: DNA polymerase IV [Clostridia bacterium]|nr:DNA polymerase IV [Clostridia bacterium]